MKGLYKNVRRAWFSLQGSALTKQSDKEYIIPCPSSNCKLTEKLHILSKEIAMPDVKHTKKTVRNPKSHFGQKLQETKRQIKLRQKAEKDKRSMSIFEINILISQ